MHELAGVGSISSCGKHSGRSTCRNRAIAGVSPGGDSPYFGIGLAGLLLVWLARRDYTISTVSDMSDSGARHRARSTPVGVLVGHYDTYCSLCYLSTCYDYAMARVSSGETRRDRIEVRSTRVGVLPGTAQRLKSTTWEFSLDRAGNGRSDSVPVPGGIRQWLESAVGH